MKPFYLVFSLFLFSSTAFAQYHKGLVPSVSSDNSVYQKIGYTKVEIRYGSPAVKGREIWGQLVPYDNVWRAGANYATSIHFSDSVSINGQALAAGTYALFIIPREETPWTLIFNRKYKQWGAFGYDSVDDALRISVSPQQKEFAEYISYSLDQLDFNHGQVNIHWETTQLSFEFETNYLQQFIEAVEEKAMNSEIKGAWVSWLQGAEYLERINAKPEQAQIWIAKAAAAIENDDLEWSSHFPYLRGHILWVKAKLSAGRGEFAEAIQMVEQLKSVDTGYSYYDREKKGEKIDQKTAEWKAALTKG